MVEDFAQTASKVTNKIGASDEVASLREQITKLTDQIKEFQDEVRRFVKTGESVITCQHVKRKNLIGLSSKVRLVITNFPRMMVITSDLRIKEQIIWNKDMPPTFTMVRFLSFFRDYTVTIYFYLVFLNELL